MGPPVRHGDLTGHDEEHQGGDKRHETDDEHQSNGQIDPVSGTKDAPLLNLVGLCLLELTSTS